MGKTSRNKGRAFEQRIRRDLQHWLGGEWSVYRIQADRQQGQTGEAGDIGAEGPWDFPLSVECKHSAAFHAGQLWKGTGPFAGWWDQAVMQARSVKRLPLLVFCGDGTKAPPLCAMESETLNELWLGCSDVGPILRLPMGEDLVSVMPWAGLLSVPSSKLREL
jgi:hypothetical protein